MSNPSSMLLRRVARAAAQKRWLATPRGHAHGSNLRPHLLQALQRTITRHEAEVTFQEYHHGSNPLLANAPGGWEKVTETFLPFWVHELVVEARASRAQVGRRVAVQRHVNNRSEVAWETLWSWAHMPFSHTSKWEPEQPEMQVCATSRYLEGDMAKMRPGLLMAQRTQPITAPGVLSPESRVVPFTVRPADARAQVLDWIRREEMQLAEAFYKQATSSEEVRFLDLELQILQQVSYPVYLPVWVFRRALTPSLLEQLLSVGLMGRQAQAIKLYTLVSGVAPGVVSGSQVYNAALAAAAAGVLGPLALFATGAAAFMSGPALLLFGVVVPVLGGAAAARHAPQLRQAAADAQRSTRQAAPALLRGLLGERLSQMLGWSGQGAAAAEEQEERRRQEAEDEAGRQSMEDPWVRAYMEHCQSRQHASSSWSQHKAEQRFRQEQQQWQWRQQQQQQQQRQWGGDAGGKGASTGSSGSSASQSFRSARDPKGFYAALGLEPGASPQEVQEAFRAKALQHHPDKLPLEQKAAATDKFKAISEAYTILRNPSKRAAYDAGGRV